MMRWLRRWPPLTWLLVYVGSLFVLMGAQEFALGIVGLALLLMALGIALYLAVRPEPGQPMPPGFAPVLGGLALFYLVSAAPAASLGVEYAAAALLGGIVPMTALALVYATARRKTRYEDGRLVDTSAEDQSPLPGIGLDSETPLGASPEVHDDLSPHDLPADHPALRGRKRRFLRKADRERAGDREDSSVLRDG